MDLSIAEKIGNCIIAATNGAVIICSGVCAIGVVGAIMYNLARGITNVSNDDVIKGVDLSGRCAVSLIPVVATSYFLHKSTHVVFKGGDIDGVFEYGIPIIMSSGLSAYIFHNIVHRFLW